MSTEYEYVITLHRAQDLDQFYDDMESNYGDTEIPNRPVQCAYRRPLSRNTHYYLTEQEAEQVKKDSRVLDVSRTIADLGLVIRPMYSQTSSGWDKSGTNNASDVNWGLLRGYERVTRANWGSDGDAAATGTIALTNTGKNVDVVIIDGHLPPDHPEFAVNPDGTGGSRVNQFNWFQYNTQVRGTAAGTYVYDFLGDTGSIDNNNHGCNVAGIAVGNTCGWARSANIYNMSPYSSSTANATGYGNYLTDLLDYIRVWHQNKPINPLTGRKNPTICNMSFGLTGAIPLQSITEIQYRGVVYTKPANGWQTIDRIYFGLVAASGTSMLFMARNSAIDADCADMINSGIILVGAAGNFLMYNERSGQPLYDNYLKYLGINNYYMRGPSPGAADGVIHVSSIDSTVSERKADYSNAGSRTDIFAAGSNIMGAYYSGGVADPRNASYNKAKLSGTSMASPQVTGLLACALETNRNMRASDALAYIQETANAEILAGGGAFNTNYGTFDFLSYNTLYGGINRYAAYNKIRPDLGQVFPRNNIRTRPTTGRTFPRQSIRRYG